MKSVFCFIKKRKIKSSMGFEREKSMLLWKFTFFLFCYPKSQDWNHSNKLKGPRQQHCPNRKLRVFHFFQAMQEKKIDFQSLGICHRFFNFVVNSLICVGLKRVTLGHPMPQGSANEGQLDKYARNGVLEPLIRHAKPNGEERAISELKDDSDSVVHIRFKQTEEELDDWTPVDKLGSSTHVAAEDEKAMKERNEFIDDLSGKKEIPLLNGISLDTNKPKIHGRTGSKIIIPISDSAGQDEKQKKAGNKFPGPKLAQPMLTGLGLNINEISELEYKGKT